MSQRKYDQSLCRLSKLLRSEQREVVDKVTIGSGCLVLLKSEGEESLNLITTTQVVDKNYLLSESSHGTPMTVEFLDGRKSLSLDLNFKDKDATESISGPIPGRVMQDTEELEQVSFIVIPVKKFDSRWFVKRALKPLARRSIPCSYETDENLQTAISNRQVLCYVICDDRKSGGFYIAEPSCLTFDRDGEFVLASTSDDDSLNHPKTINDLPKEQKPKGALLLNGAGKLVGMLAVSRSDNRKLYPVFLPNLEKESTYTQDKDKWNSASASYSQHKSATSEITGKCDEPRMGCSDEEMARHAEVREMEMEKTKCQGLTKPPNQTESANTRDALLRAELQGSSNPAVHPCKSDDSLPDARPDLNDQSQQGQLPPLGENADDESEQVEPHDDNLQESSEFNNPSGTSDYSSNQSCASSSSHSAADGEDFEGKFSSINENAHDSQQAQNLQSQGSYRPGLLTQHSHHDDHTGLRSSQDQGNPRIPATVSDPTPKTYDETGFRERREPNSGAGRSMYSRSQSDAAAVFPSSGDSGQANIGPRTHHYSIKQREHVNAGSSVKEKVVSKASVMDMICLHLDRSVAPRVPAAAPIRQRWEHLADEFKVPDDVKRRCENYKNYTRNLSPSEVMFEYLRTTRGSLKIETIKEYLGGLGRKDVIKELEENKYLSGNATVADLCEKCPETLSNICIQLDDKRFVNNWHDLGLKIGINGKQLRKLQDSSEFSPAEDVLNTIYTLEPDLLLTKMKDDLETLNLVAGINSNIANALGKFEAGSTIKTLLDDPDALEEVAALLDYNLGWDRVGKKYGMTKLQRDSLKPECPESPTKLVMGYIVGDDPQLNMKRFLEGLANIKRFDVISELKEFFHGKISIDEVLIERFHSRLMQPCKFVATKEGVYVRKED